MVGAVSVVRIVARRPFLREVRAHPRLAGMGAIVAIAGLLVVALFAVRMELVRRLVTGAVALGVIGAFVRSRPGYGRSRGLPPGSLGLGASLDAIDDRAFYATSAERLGPVFKMSQFHRPVACTTDLQTWLAFDAANEDALVQSDWSFNRLVPGGYLEYMNGELHTRYRAHFAPAFSPDVVEASCSAMLAIAREQLATMHRASQPEGVHPEPYLLPIAQVSLLRAVLGVGAEHPRFDSLREYFSDLNRPMELYLPAPRSSQETFRWLASTVAELARDGTASPSVLAHLLASQPDLANDETAIGNLVLMVKEGSIMVRGMLRWVVKLLADHPEVVEDIRAASTEPARLEALTTAFVNETVRLHESPYLYRSVTRDVELGGYRVPKGWLVRLCLAEAHSDSQSFVEPKSFDPSRFQDAAAHVQTTGLEGDTPGFCPFGKGRHACVGGGVAVEIAKAVVQEAALGYNLHTLKDGAAWRINRHWGLWRPSLALRVVLEPLGS